MHTKIMKKTYITPSIECIAYCTEHVMALSIVEGGKADGTLPSLSNGRADSDWDFYDDNENF